MSSRRICTVTLAIAVLLGCWTGGVHAPAATPAEKLAEAARDAAKNFQPVKEADLQQAHNDLSGAIERLDVRLTMAGASGDDWRQFLDWKKLQAELAKKNPDLDELNRILDQYSSGYTTLQKAPFQDVRRALEHYVDLARAEKDPKAKDDYQRNMEELAKHLEAYGKQPNTKDAYWIDGILQWLAEANLAGGLRDEVRKEFQHPNLFIQVAAATVAAAMDNVVDEVAPFSDNILGTNIQGTGHTTGTLSAHLVPDARFAIVDLTFLGYVQTNNVGVNGPAQVQSQGSTGVGAVKRLWADADGLSATPRRVKPRRQASSPACRSTAGGGCREWPTSAFTSRSRWPSRSRPSTPNSGSTSGWMPGRPR